MAGQQLTPKEQEKSEVLRNAITGKITNNQAAKQLGLSVRQVQRVKARIRRDGIVGIVHGLKRKPGNHRLSCDTKDQAIRLIKNQYADFKPTFAAEKLAENHEIHISPETARLWMIEKDIWKMRKQKRPAYRSWRPRKEYYGELEQFDGSYHYWFEDRYRNTNGNPIEVCLLASIDDATGQITKAMFAPHEGVIPVFTFWQEYITEIGKPVSIYLDAFSTYKINHKNAVDNKELMTQFERASRTLGIQLITAHSPEAKGRVERLFGTLQDRLVKEMRLQNINNPEQGNKFLKDVFLSMFKQKFAVQAAKDGNIHREILKQEKEQLCHIFSIHETRRVNLDFTIQFKNSWYQLLELQPVTVRPLEKVCMQTWIDGSIHIVLREHELSYVLLPERPKKQQISQPTILTTHALNYKPPPNYPWRRYHKIGY
jgi:hypothetical protein